MPTKVRNYCITVNNWTQEQLDAIMEMTCIKYGLLGEEGNMADETPHLQGYIRLKRSMTLTALQKAMKTVGIKCHLEVSKGNSRQNKKYCSKEGITHEWGEDSKQGSRNDLKAIADMLNNGVPMKEIREMYPGQWFRYRKSFDELEKITRREGTLESLKLKMSNVQLRSWQQDIVTRLLHQDNRKVLWVIDEVGNTGKSWLSKYLFVKHGAFEMTGGKTADIAYAYKQQSIVAIDLSRQKKEYFMYSILEDFKNGKIFSPKYESASERFEPAKVVVFSNWHPDYKELSADRWDIVYMGSVPNNVIQNMDQPQEWDKGFYFRD